MGDITRPGRRELAAGLLFVRPDSSSPLDGLDAASGAVGRESGRKAACQWTGQTSESSRPPDSS